MRLLIDGDGLIYRCGFAIEKTKYLLEIDADHVPFDDHKSAKARMDEAGSGVLWSRKEFEPVENAYHLIKQVMGDMPKHTSFEMWLTPSMGNFRDHIATRAKYKGNRDYANRPKFYKEITGYLIDRYGAKYAEGEEADDALGIRLTELGREACVVSFDKDLLQVPGRHYNWVTKEAAEVSFKDAALNFYSQVLSGDPVDNVPGLPGIGPAKARKILAGVGTPGDAWDRCVEKYCEIFGADGYKYALETARLVYVRRKPNEIWTPPTEAKASVAA